MTDPVKSACIIGAAIIVSAALLIYFSPYQTCIRAIYDKRANTAVADAQLCCAQLVGGRR
jgi:hypothetical protein